MKFFMPMIPPTVTHQEQEVTCRGGKPKFYEPPELKEARAKLTAHLGQHRPTMAHSGPLRCLVKWIYFDATEVGTWRWKHTRPDTHNLNKLLFDIMTDLGFWHDDAQVASELIEKFYSDKPGIFIQIEELL